MFHTFIGRLKLSISRDPILYTLIISSVAYFLLCYITNPVRPAGIFGYQDKAIYPLGWFGYYDQGEYLKLAHTLASFKLDQLSTTYSYGLGYPLVAVPAIWLGFNKDPFVFFNLVTFVFTVYAVYRVARHFISPLAGFLAGFGLIFATPLIYYTDQPWNSTVCLFAISGIFVIATINKINKWHALVAGFLVGWAFAARYIDIAWLGPLAVACLYRGSFKNLFKVCVFGAIGLSLWVMPVLYSHYRVFGSPFRTPYVNHVGIGGVGGSDQQAGAYSLRRVPNAALGMFVSPRLAGSLDVERGLLVGMFWILASIPGAIILLRKTERKLFFSVFIGATIVATLFYLSFRASTPSSLKYGVLHYFKMFWPGLVILAVAFFDDQLKKTAKFVKNSDISKKS